MNVFVRVLLFTGGVTLYFGGIMVAAYTLRAHRRRKVLEPANDPRIEEGLEHCDEETAANVRAQRRWMHWRKP
jgi:hypothetical protein